MFLNTSAFFRGAFIGANSVTLALGNVPGLGPRTDMKTHIGAQLGLFILGMPGLFITAERKFENFAFFFAGYLIGCGGVLLYNSLKENIQATPVLTF